MKVKNKKLKIKSSGFSLVEIILVMGIMAILTVAGLGRYSGLRNTKALENMVNRIGTDINYTMQRSKAQEGGLQWWMYFNNSVQPNYYSICSGDNYSPSGNCTGGTQAQRVQITAGFSVSYSGDLIFRKSTGLPVYSSGNAITAPITVIVSSNWGVGPKSIVIDKNGRVDY